MPTVIVTGGGGALGQAICKALATEGWRIVVADIKPEFAQETLDLLGDAAVEKPIIVDVGQFAAVKAAVAAVAERHGLDGLVNCAGGTMALRVPKGPLVDSLPEHWDRMINVNLYGTFNCCHAVSPFLKRAGGGTIVNIGSMSAQIVNRPQWQPAYNASKAAVHHLTRSLAAEWAPMNVRVNALAPGYMHTDMSPIHEPQFQRYWIEDAPQQRAGEPDELGPGIVFLASDASSFMTGSVLTVDGGYTVF
jgi:NAD(P)-dependent dehydrogenase (short-subunit alcohol dehydrogenase family)